MKKKILTFTALLALSSSYLGKKRHKGLTLRSALRRDITVMYGGMHNIPHNFEKINFASSVSEKQKKTFRKEHKRILNENNVENMGR